MMKKNRALTKEIQDTLTPQLVLTDLLEGNKRFISDSLQAIDYKALIKQTAGAQYPKAVILSCIDSRMPVETIFNQAIGDVFVVRVAGNFENTDILGSIEFACKVSGSKLVLVLGHEACGAIKSACDDVKIGNITAMLDNILPAVKQSADELEKEADSSDSVFVAKTVENNVRLTIERIRAKSPVLKEMEDKGEIQIVGGVYMISTGKVEML